MKIKNPFTKENLVNAVKNLGKLRPKMDHASIITFSALALILFIAFVVRLFPIRWEIDPTTGKSTLLLSEFDPYFQYRFTEYIVKNGFITWAWPKQWNDTQRWYPQGFNVARGAYPGLPLTAAFFYKIISMLGVGIDLMSFCSLFPAIMGMLACLAIYFLGKDIGGKPVGLLAALSLALHPSYIQRTSVGFFDDETVGIFSLILFAFLFLRAIEEDRNINSTVKYALASGAVLGYFCASWGAAYYPIGVTVLFVFLSLITKRYTRRLLLAYSITFGLGLFIAINVPYLSPNYLLTTAIITTPGVFSLLFLAEILNALPTRKWKVIAVLVFLMLIIGGFAVLWHFNYMQGIAGKFISVVNPFTRAESPLYESVAEHRISAWGSIYYDLGIGIIFFAVGLFFLFGNLNNKNLFLLVLGLTSLYFACSMVRLLVLMAPAFSLLVGVGVNGLLKPFIALLKEPPKISVKKKYGLESVGKEFSGAAIFLIFLILMTSLAFPIPFQRVYRQAYTPTTISSGSLSIVPKEPVQEWINMLYWTRTRLSPTTVVCSWWDYGYWLTILGNVTTLADNATANITQIENIGFIFMSNETQAIKMLKRYNAEYILVFVTIYYDSSTGNVNFANVGGDEGKWTWMAAISGKARQRFISQGLISENEMWTSDLDKVREKFGNYSLGYHGYDSNNDGRIDKTEPVPQGQNCTIYKLMNYALERWRQQQKGGGSPATQLLYFSEAYIAGLENDATKYGGVVPLVCLYKINYPPEQ